MYCHLLQCAYYYCNLTFSSKKLGKKTEEEHFRNLPRRNLGNFHSQSEEGQPGVKSVILEQGFSFGDNFSPLSGQATSANILSCHT